jgi:aspartate carbamoyltransferase catalytic subunit
MTLKGRSLVTIDDFTCSEMDGIFTVADEMGAARDRQYGLCQGKVMASLFFEPSTRTRLSFEAAMSRLGGRVISVTDPQATSLAKGESLADTARIVGSYADIIVIRHPWEGAARVIADYAGVPVINGGDGGHQHPTQTLCDIYTLRRERGTVAGLKIALWGDLKYGRTIHSLIFALAKFGADILFCPSPGLEVPEHVIKKLVAEYGGEVRKSTSAPGMRRGSRGRNGRPESIPLDAVYITPSSSHQLALVPGVDVEIELDSGVDALYVTRPQKERFSLAEAEMSSQKNYPVVDKALLKDKAFKKSVVLHPLPRVDELAYELDADPRSRYFKQAALGVPVRMALIAALLGAKEIQESIAEAGPVPSTGSTIYRHDSNIRCANPRCVSRQPTEANYIKPRFLIVDTAPVTLRCVYCEHGYEPRYIASSEWHQGMPENKRYHQASSHLARQIKPENLIVFDSREEAEARGYKPGHYAGTESQV